MSHLLENTLIRYPPSNNSLLSSGNAKKSIAYEPRTEAISPAINDDILNTEDSDSKSTKDEQTLLVDKLKKVEQEIRNTDLQIVRLRKQKDQLEQAANSASKHDDDQENVCDTKQLSIAKLVYHENRAKTQKAYAKLECLGGSTKDLPLYNQPSDNAIYHHNAAKFNNSFKSLLISCFKLRLDNRLKLEESVSTEYDRRMEKWLKSIEIEDSQPAKRIKDAKTREFFEKQFPELKKARESGERFSRVGQRVARSDAELDELLDGITEREDQDKKVKSYAVIPPMLEEMRSRKPKFNNTNGYVEDIEAQYKEYQILNTWTDEEKDIFRETYLQHPKNFGLIARMTNRKNVANCVQYYYLSKKSENYKQLVKRQQKRRTRSFVRPAQATPAIPTLEGNDTQNSKTTNGLNNNNNNNNNDKQGGDNSTTELTGQSSEQSDGSKLGALDDRADIKNSNADVNMIDRASNRTNSTCCCICNCEFSENNQFRNVTRSNYQLYGIGLETLRPGMRICYPCRFRHVKHPSFDEPLSSPELMHHDNMMMDDNETQEGHNISETNQNDQMEVDPPNIKSDPEPVIENNLSMDGIIKLNIPARPSSPTRDGMAPDDLSGPSNGEPTKGTQRTCVRDIIYQAIEMSFQKPKAAEPMDVHSKPVDNQLRPECAPTNPVLSQHTISNILPMKQMSSNHSLQNQLQAPQPPPPPPPSQQQHPPPPPPIPHLPPIQTIGPEHQLHVEMQLKQKHLLELNFRQHQMQQLQMQQSQQFRHQQYQLPPHQPNQIQLGQPPQLQAPLQPPPRPQQQPAPILSRHPSQPMQVAPLPSPMRLGPPPAMQPTAPHPMMTAQQAPPVPHLPPPPPMASVAAQQKPIPPAAQQHQLASSVPSAHHPLNLCRKYSEPTFAPDPARAQAHSKTRPPMAHGGNGPKMAPPPQSRVVAEEFVLNLSKPASFEPANPKPAPPPPPPPQHQIQQQKPPPPPQLPPVVSTTCKPAATIVTPTPKPATIEPVSLKPATVEPAIPKPITTDPAAISKPGSPEQPTPKPVAIEQPPIARPTTSPAAQPTIAGPATPPQPATRQHDSPSPNLSASPTSPSEMVIDESADAPSPASSPDQLDSSAQ